MHDDNKWKIERVRSVSQKNEKHTDRIVNCKTLGKDSQGVGGRGHVGMCVCRELGVSAETLYHRDDAFLYIAYVMLIWAAPIPADRWHCSLWP